jgi:hypothetical protein
LLLGSKKNSLLMAMLLLDGLARRISKVSASPILACWSLLLTIKSLESHCHPAPFWPTPELYPRS